MVQVLDLKIGKIAEGQDQDKNYGPVGLTTGGSNTFGNYNIFSAYSKHFTRILPLIILL